MKDASGLHHRTPAMASGLTDRIWSTREWLLSPSLGGGKDHHRTRPEMEQGRYNQENLFRRKGEMLLILFF
jgi:hypothetical protein